MNTRYLDPPRYDLHGLDEIIRWATSRRGKIIPVDFDGPMPIDLRAYIVASNYDPDKRTFGKVIPELVKHQDRLHPYARRFLLETLRKKQAEHARLAKAYGDIADQFGNDTPEAA